jgi:NAD(P)-dependent dehydrogenase (short-subunit alcohol dehydrogenase family)
MLADHDEHTLEAVCQVLAGDGYVVEAEVTDVSVRSSLTALAAAAIKLGSVTRVAHTAGVSPAQASTQKILAVDLLGVVYSLEELGAVISRGGSGVYIASMAGTMAAGQFPQELETALATAPADELLHLPLLSDPSTLEPLTAYSIAKRANQLRVQVASLAWGARQARVNSISPGVIATTMGQQELAGESGELMRAMVKASGTGRLGTSADVAGAAIYLLGDEASFITGTDLLVDGGVIAAIRAGALTPAIP